MKRIWIIIAIALIGATNCSHPYEEGMTGAFPFIELMSGTSISMDAVGSQTGVIELNTNMRISTKVDYPNTATSGSSRSCLARLKKRKIFWIWYPDTRAETTSAC